MCSPRTFQQRWFSRREFEDFKCRSSVDCGGLFQPYRPALSGRGVPDPSPVLRYFGGLLDGLFTVRCRSQRVSTTNQRFDVDILNGLVFQGCGFTGCTGMIQGINEHVATYSLMA